MVYSEFTVEQQVNLALNGRYVLKEQVKLHGRPIFESTHVNKRTNVPFYVLWSNGRWRIVDAIDHFVQKEQCLAVCAVKKTGAIVPREIEGPYWCVNHPRPQGTKWYFALKVDKEEIFGGECAQFLLRDQGWLEMSATWKEQYDRTPFAFEALPRWKQLGFRTEQGFCLKKFKMRSIEHWYIPTYK